MGDHKGFMKYKRELPKSRKVEERIKDYRDIYSTLSDHKVEQQAARCMDCGVAFCHHGCPLGNLIPAFNDAIHQQDWKLAYEVLNETNNFPEFTGRICPAPCEAACVLGINQSPVTIENIERHIIEMAFKNDWVKVPKVTKRSGKRVAVIGSGPAGLAAAEQLNKAGHLVSVYERSDRPGGLLRYGIPDFKLEKWVLDRRIALMEAAGIRFITNAHVGQDVEVQQLLAEYDALVLCGGASQARDLAIPGRELEGVHLAMDFLEQSNRRVAGDQITEGRAILATQKQVVVIGGGDTGADCMGTSHRQQASKVTQIELLAKPPAERDASTPWPLWPMQLRESSSHEEGGERHWAMMTKAFLGDEWGRLRALQIVDVEWQPSAAGTPGSLREIEGSERELPCELALLAIGFLRPPFAGLLEQLGVELDKRGNVKAEDFRTNVEKVFVAGDMQRGQSLVVWAISEGREAAKAVDRFLMGSSELESKAGSILRV
ncbi:MAG: glutamate synthase subunit beta [Bacteroidota bacterium]